MRFKPILYIALAFGLASLSRSFELRGDLAPLAESGVSSERAQYHITALLCMLGAMALFISAGVSAFRRS
ncbi:MAG TPA: hypothetical protein VF577_04675 [Allosphingosinicella sp.]|jgi:hypothetical protein